MKPAVVIMILVLAIGILSIFVFKAYSEYNSEKISAELEGANLQIDILLYALKIAPDDFKNEVYSNAIKEKYPDLEKFTNILKVINPKYENKEQSSAKKTEKQKISVMETMSQIMDTE